MPTSRFKATIFINSQVYIYKVYDPPNTLFFASQLFIIF